MNYKILVVDDEPANTRMLERVLRNQFDVVSANSGPEGLELLNIHDVALIISDQRMPGMTGVEFLKRSAELRPHCVRIILTGYTDAADLADALNSNVVYKYVTKPWAGPDLLQTVKRGLSHYETIKAQHRLNLENERLRGRLISAEDCFLRLCSELLGLRDERSLERSPRVRDLALKVGKALGLDGVTLETLAFSACLHALADLHIPENLLKEHTQLSAAEILELESCRERGLKLLAEVPNLQEVEIAIRYLSEHFDGSGGPRGLNGTQIPLVSRIIAVVRAFDAMVFPDSGVEALSKDEAVAKLQVDAGRCFDPNVVSAFCGLMAIDEMRRTVPEQLALVT